MNKTFIENNIMLIDNIVSQSIIVEQCFGCGKRIAMNEHNEERYSCECKLSYFKVYDKDDNYFRLVIDCKQRPDVHELLKTMIAQLSTPELEGE